MKIQRQGHETERERKKNSTEERGKEGTRLRKEKRKDPENNYKEETQKRKGREKHRN